jgi:hypothetical protein
MQPWEESCQRRIPSCSFRRLELQHWDVLHIACRPHHRRNDDGSLNEASKDDRSSHHQESNRGRNRQKSTETLADDEASDRSIDGHQSVVVVAAAAHDYRSYRHQMSLQHGIHNEDHGGQEVRSVDPSASSDAKHETHAMSSGPSQMKTRQPTVVEIDPEWDIHPSLPPRDDLWRVAQQSKALPLSSWRSSPSDEEER